MIALAVVLLNGCAQPATTYTRAPNVLTTDPGIIGLAEPEVTARFGEPCVSYSDTEGGRYLIYPMVESTVTTSCFPFGYVLGVRLSHGVSVGYYVGEL